MTHGDYQPVLHPPPSDLGEHGPHLYTHPHHHPTITPLRALQTHQVRALYEEAARVTKRNRYLHPKTSRTGYCKLPGALI